MSALSAGHCLAFCATSGSLTVLSILSSCTSPPIPGQIIVHWTNSFSMTLFLGPLLGNPSGLPQNCLSFQDPGKPTTYRKPALTTCPYWNSPLSTPILHTVISFFHVSLIKPSVPFREEAELIKLLYYTYLFMVLDAFKVELCTESQSSRFRLCSNITQLWFHSGLRLGIFLNPSVPQFSYLSSGHKTHIYLLELIETI